MGSCDVNMDDFMDDLQEEIDGIAEDVDQALEYAAMSVINDARLNGPYTDRTGNLRHSLGYAIVDDGNVTRQSIPEIDGSIGKDVIEREAPKIDGMKGVILVAGMPYAFYVEAKGYDVLTGSAVNIDKYFKEAMEG